MENDIENDGANGSDGGWRCVRNKKNNRKWEKEASGVDSDVNLGVRNNPCTAKRENSSKSFEDNWTCFKEGALQEIKMKKHEQNHSEEDVRATSAYSSRGERRGWRGKCSPSTEYSQELATQTVIMRSCSEGKRENSCRSLRKLQTKENKSQEWPKLGVNCKSTEHKQDDFSFAGKLSGRMHNKGFSYQLAENDKTVNLRDAVGSQPGLDSVKCHPRKDNEGFSEPYRKSKLEETKCTDYSCIKKRDLTAAKQIEKQAEEETHIRKVVESTTEATTSLMPEWKREDKEKMESTKLQDTYVFPESQSVKTNEPPGKKSDRSEKETVHSMKDEKSAKNSGKEEQQTICSPNLGRFSGRSTDMKRTNESNNADGSEAAVKVLLPPQQKESNWRAEQSHTTEKFNWSCFNSKCLTKTQNELCWRSSEQKMIGPCFDQSEQKTSFTTSKQFTLNKPQEKCVSETHRSESQIGKQKIGNQHSAHFLCTKGRNEQFQDPQRLSSSNIKKCVSNMSKTKSFGNSEFKPSKVETELQEKDFPPLQGSGILNNWIPPTTESFCNYVAKACLETVNSTNSSKSSGTAATISKAVKTRKKQPKAKDPICMNIIEIAKPLSAMRQCHKYNKPKRVGQVLRIGGNMLDSSNPVRKRGKHRELPRKKRPTRLKSSVLHERRQRKIAKQESDVASVLLVCSNEAHCSKNEILEGNAHESSAKIENGDGPLMVTEPLPGLTLNSVEGKSSQKHVNEACISGNEKTVSSSEDSVVKSVLHSAKFREYCENSKTPQLDAAVLTLIAKLLAFQTKKYKSDPTLAHSKRRLVFGMREVNKYLILKKMKMVVIAPDLENAPGEGGLNEAITKIKEEATKQSVPVIFAAGRRKLGYATFKKVPVSIVGITNFEGAEELHQDVVQNLHCAVEQYQMSYKAMLRSLFPEHSASEHFKMRPEGSVLTDIEQVKIISEQCLAVLREQ